MKLHTDVKAEKDLLGRLPLAQRISIGLFYTIRTNPDGFVTALTGKWGSGKTTLMGFVKKEVEHRFANEKLSPLIIEFNPWVLANADDLRTAMLRHLAYSLTPSRPFWEKVLVKHSNKLEHLDLAHSGLGKLGKEVSSLIKEYLDSSNSVTLKNRIDKLLLAANKKIFVFIDDIDRLSPKQIFELMQVLKLTGNFKNTYYIVAYDREAVETAIETQFKGYGKKYLDKIVQIDFSVPEIPDEKIEAILFNGLDGVFQEHKINYKSSLLSSVWLHRGLRLYFHTLRDVYRYINSLQFSLPAISEDIDVTDFLILEAIRLHDFDAYQLIYLEMDQNNHHFGASSNLLSENILSKFSNVATRMLVQYLFSGTSTEWFHQANNLRLYDPKNFIRYFTLQVPTRDISELEFRRFMENITDRLGEMNKILNLGRLENLLIRLSDSDLYKQYNNWTFSLVEDIFKFFSINAENIENPHRIADAIINLLHQKENEKENYFNQFLKLLMAQTKEVDRAKIYFFHFILESRSEDNGFPPKGAYEFKNFYSKRYEAIEKNYNASLQEWHSYFLSNPIPRPLSYYTLLFAYDYSTYFPEEFARKVHELLLEEENLIFFVKNSLSISSNGEAFRVNGQAFKKLLVDDGNMQLFYQNLVEMDTSSIIIEQKQWRAFLINYFEENNKY